VTPARVLLETDEDLAVGEFGIATSMVQRDSAKPTIPKAGRFRRDMIYNPKVSQPTEAASAEELGVYREVASSLGTGQTPASTKRRVLSVALLVNAPSRSMIQRLAPSRGVATGGATTGIGDL